MSVELKDLRQAKEEEKKTKEAYIAASRKRAKLQQEIKELLLDEYESDGIISKIEKASILRPNEYFVYGSYPFAELTLR